MSAAQDVEIDVDLIVASIKANIGQALADVSASRAQAVASLQLPKEYFVEEHVAAYRLPAVFVIADNTDFRLSRGQNFVDSLSRINVSVVVEGKITQDLARSAWRYQAALRKILHGIPLVSGDGLVKIVPKVVRASFSPLYTNAQKAGDMQGSYRKEVLLALDVEHYESLT